MLRGYERQQRVEKRREAASQPAPTSPRRRAAPGGQPQKQPAAAAGRRAGRPGRGRARLPAGRREVTRRRGATAIASNPVLVGVATTLVIVVAVFLAYNANQGLPWVPTYRLTGRGARARASLVKGNEVRIGGLRVGVVDKITPVQQDDGSVDGQARPEARDPDQAAARGLDDHDPAALRARPQVHRGHEGRLRAGIPRGRHDPARRTRRPSRSSSTSSSTCGTSPRGSATSRTCAGSATPSPGRGADLNLRAPGVRAAGRRTRCRC